MATDTTETDATHAKIILCEAPSLILDSYLSYHHWLWLAWWALLRTEWPVDWRRARLHDIELRFWQSMPYKDQVKAQCCIESTNTAFRWQCCNESNSAGCMDGVHKRSDLGQLFVHYSRLGERNRSHMSNWLSALQIKTPLRPCILPRGPNLHTSAFITIPNHSTMRQFER